MLLFPTFPVNTPSVQKLGIWRSILMYYGIPFRKQRMMHFYAQFIKPKMLCYDIGAHLGNRIRVWAALGATVVGVEPQPLCYNLLNQWYGNTPNVTLLDQALGASSANGQQKTLFISQRTPTVSTLSSQWMAEVEQAKSFTNVEWDATATVTITPLDELIAHFGEPAFCKIDVEGYELEVLHGLSRPLQTLSFEYVPASQKVSLDCIDYLAQLGYYEFNWSIGESHRLQSAHWISAEQMAHTLASMEADENSGDVYARVV